MPPGHRASATQQTYFRARSIQDTAKVRQYLHTTETRAVDRAPTEQEHDRHRIRKFSFFLFLVFYQTTTACLYILCRNIKQTFETLHISATNFYLHKSNQASSWEQNRVIN